VLTASPARARRALVALALAAAACSEEPSGQDCPGAVLARLQLHGTLVEAACAADPDGAYAVPLAYPADPDPDDGVVPTAGAVLAFDAASGEAALCNGNRYAAPPRGPRTGDHLRLEASVAGAVLAGCGGCRPRTTVVIEGDLSGPAGGAPTAFAGTLTETLHDPEPVPGGANPCSPCVLPCAATYTLHGTAESSAP
jgi:hypothetical protein